MTRTKIYSFLYVDVENLDGGGSGAFNVATSEAEGDDEEQEKGISRIENEEETSQMNGMF